MALPIAQIANPRVQMIGVAINSRTLDEEKALCLFEDPETRMDLPATDPYHFDTANLLIALVAI